MTFTPIESQRFTAAISTFPNLSPESLRTKTNASILLLTVIQNPSVTTEFYPNPIAGLHIALWKSDTDAVESTQSASMPRHIVVQQQNLFTSGNAAPTETSATS
jgi:hypothetical protein